VIVVANEADSKKKKSSKKAAKKAGTKKTASKKKPAKKKTPAKEKAPAKKAAKKKASKKKATSKKAVKSAEEKAEADEAATKEADAEKVEAKSAEPEKKEPEKGESEKTDPEKNEPEQAEPAKTEPEPAELEKAEPAKTDPEQAEPPKAEPEKTESLESEPESFPDETSATIEEMGDHTEDVATAETAEKTDSEDDSTGAAHMATADTVEKRATELGGDGSDGHRRRVKSITQTNVLAQTDELDQNDDGLNAIPENVTIMPGGTTLGSYRLIQHLAQGGMGHVYEAEHEQLGRKVALKVMRSEVAKREEAVTRFFTEARAVNKIKHQHIVQITDIFDEGADKYFVMEYLEGEDLGTRIKREGSIPASEVLPILRQLAGALAAAHDVGIIHRDIKPDNVFLVKRPGGEVFVKLLDFGVAKLLEKEISKNTAETSAGSLIGTPDFMTPEQFNSNPVDGRTDLYALGLVAYYALTGEKAFKGKNLGELAVQHLTSPVPSASHKKGAAAPIPLALDRLIQHCLQKKPADRPQSAQEVKAALDLIKAGGPTASRITSRHGPVRSILAGPVGILTLFFLLGVAVMIFFSEQTENRKVLPQSEDEVVEPIDAEPIPPDPPKGVSVTSQPPGAEVVVVQTGKVLGMTPYEVPPGFSSSPFEVELRLKGHRAQRFTVNPNGGMDITGILRPEPKNEGGGVKKPTKKPEELREVILDPFAPKPKK
jgi:serine/threonine-protein kinase